MINIKTPFKDADLDRLKSGDMVFITGTIYTGRDVVHKRFIELIESGNPLPFDIKGQIIYYVGPTPTPPGKVIGSCGPTTSSRMDSYTPILLERGLKGMIGKGSRSKEVVEAIKRFKAVYFIAIGGCGALISKTIRDIDIIAFPELGPEAVFRLEVENFPTIVGIDSSGNSIIYPGNPL